MTEAIQAPQTGAHPQGDDAGTSDQHIPTGVTQETSGSESKYDFDQDLLRNPEKAVRVAKDAISAKDRIAGEHRQLLQKMGTLVQLAEQFGGDTLVRYLTHYGAIRSHPELRTVAQTLETTGQIPSNLRLRPANGHDDPEEDLREPWEKLADELRQETLQVRRELQGIQARTGVEAFKGHAKSFFSEQWPDLPDEDRSELSRSVESTIEQYGRTGAAGTLTNLNRDQVWKFIQGQMTPQMMERALVRKQQRENADRSRATTDSPSGVRTTGREAPANPPQRVGTREVLDAWRESAGAARR